MDIKSLFDWVSWRVNESESLVRLGRFCSTDLLLEIGDEAVYLAIREGKLAHVQHGQRPMKSWQFAIRASAEDWRSFWDTMPDPEHHDLFAMTRYGHARFDGDIGPFLSNLRFIKALLALPRELYATPSTRAR